MVGNDPALLARKVSVRLSDFCQILAGLLARETRPRNN